MLSGNLSWTAWKRSQQGHKNVQRPLHAHRKWNPKKHPPVKLEKWQKVMLDQIFVQWKGKPEAETIQRICPTHVGKTLALNIPKCSCRVNLSDWTGKRKELCTIPILKKRPEVKADGSFLFCYKVCKEVSRAWKKCRVKRDAWGSIYWVLLSFLYVVHFRTNQGCGLFILRTEIYTVYASICN